MSSASHDHQGHRAAAWMQWVARVGIVAEGLIYLLIGGLALAGAFDPAQQPSGSNAAMWKLAHAPLGPLLLALLALGLLAYVVWQLLLAILDPECAQGRWTIRRVVLGIHHLWSAALHGVLVGIAAWQLLGFGHGDNHGQTQKHLAAMAFQFPGGRWLVGGIGAGIVVFALLQWILAFRPQQDTRMDLSDTCLRLPILTLLVLGYVGRGVLFALIGVFAIYSAWQHDPNETIGISGALQSIRHHPCGPWLLGAVALGLIAFGLAQLAKSRYRRVRID